MDCVTARIVCGMYGIEGTLHHHDLMKKWSAVYMMNAMFLLKRRFKPFRCGQRWIRNWSMEIMLLFAYGFFRGEKMRWDTKFL